MGLEAKFTRTDIRAMLDARRANIKRAILSRLQFVGEDFVKNAREKTREQGGFGDVTGNLRSSIGYIVMDHGKIVSQGFQSFSGGSQGMAKAKQLTQRLSSQFPDGYALIVVAGMEYAASVENLYHKDVITGSSLIAEAKLKQALARIKEKSLEI